MVVECPSTDIAASEPAWVIKLFLSCVDRGPNERTIAHLIILIKSVTDSRTETCKALNGGVVGSGIALQAERSRVLLPMRL